METVEEIEAILDAVVGVNLVFKECPAEVELLFLDLADTVGLYRLRHQLLSGIK